MAPMKFTKSHERQEARLLRKGFSHSWIALFLCWLPIGGLFFAISGFVRVIVRLTRKFRVRRRAYLAFSFVVLCLCIGALLGEIWVYSRDPGVLTRIRQSAWTFVTGQESGPVSTPAPGTGTAYTDMDTAGLGVLGGTGELQEESDGLVEQDPSGEDWQSWDENFDWEEWENSEDWSDADFWLDGEDPFPEDDLPSDDPAIPDDLLTDEGLDWLDEGDDGIIWLDENGQPLPPETSLRVGAGEPIELPKE